MNEINHSGDDIYTTYGRKFFLDKYGISFKDLNKTMPKESPHFVFKGNSLLSQFRDINQLLFNDSELFNNDETLNSHTIFGLIGFALSGRYEKVWTDMNMKKNIITCTPLVDLYCEMLLDRLLENYETLNLPVVSKSFWPDGKYFSVCLTHDVDEIRKTYQWITFPYKYARKHDIQGVSNQFISLFHKIKGKEPFWTFRKIIEIENKFNTKSSFFFLKETGKVKLFDCKTWRHAGRRYDFKDPNVTEMIKELFAGGWDVGLHGSFYSYDNGNKIEKEKKELESVLGNKVSGIRQHNLNLKIPDTWLYQEKAGFEYDTTLGFNDRLGFRWGTCFPFRPFYPDENKTLNILEIPLIIEDLPFFRNEDPWEGGLQIIKTVEKYGGVLTLLWHHSVYNDHEFPEWGVAYEKIIDFCNKKDAWITSAKEISDWWMMREKSSFEWDYEGNQLRIKPYPIKNHHFLNIYVPNKMYFKNIFNAEIINVRKNLYSIKTNCLEEDEFVRVELCEAFYGNRSENSG